MGEIPKKALRESQLQKLTVGTAVNIDGAHQTYRVKFIENGQEKKGFFKKLAPKKDYPELLAKISVATSLLKRIFQGKRSAEERLIFDDNDTVVGTLSISIEDFKQFNYAEEAVPIDPRERELVIPSTKTLIDKNIIELLLGRWFLDDDDGHPHNLSLVGDIDFDMFWYWFTIHMKKSRPIIGIPKTHVTLTVRDWEDFPNIKDAKPYHWPAYTHPGQETLPNVVPLQGSILTWVLPKIYADPSQFANLAKSSEAHDQKFEAALKVLLTYQPKMMRTRLLELFGNMTLNYTSLDQSDPEARAIYEKEYSRFCNENTNVGFFVDFIMSMYQEHFDNLYRVVVLYMGCDSNNYGLSLPATCNTLFRMPEFYKRIKDWVVEQNRTIYANDGDLLKFNEDELEQRYHSIWRDSFAPILKDLLHGAYNLTNKVLENASKQAKLEGDIAAKEVTDDDLTTVIEFIGTIRELPLEKIENLIVVDKESRLREGLLLLVKFTNKFNTIVKAYYEKKREDLKKDDNVEFCRQLGSLIEEFNFTIREKLAFTSNLSNEFSAIVTRLQSLKSQVDFRIHLTTSNEGMQHSFINILPTDTLPATSDQVKEQYNTSLFIWARGLKQGTGPGSLDSYVIDIINDYYVKLFSNRFREKPVKEYLATSQYDSNDNRLAYILCSGNKDGSLDPLLVEHLTKKMLESHYLPSVKKAVENKTFEKDIKSFTESVIGYAQTDKQFMHLYHDDAVKHFQNLFFSYLKRLPEKYSTEQFDKLLKDSLADYEKGLNTFSFYYGNSRRKEVMGYQQQNKNNYAKIVALTLSKGDNTSTLSMCLINKVINLMKDDYSKVKFDEHPEYKLILQYNAEEHKKMVLSWLKDASVPITHEQEIHNKLALASSM